MLNVDGKSKANLEATIAEYDLEVKNAEMAENTSVDKARWAGKLVTLKAEREKHKGLLRSLQKP